VDLFRSPGFLVNRLGHEMAQALEQRFKMYDVTISQWAVLLMLWEQGEGKSQVELQELLGLEGATVTGLVQRMERSDLVQRRPDPQDKRVSRVYLTDRGRSLEHILTPLAQEVNACACQGFTSDEQAFFLRLLQRALDNFESS
jgi:DNA-binding MarR family transcriptional regulator